jgi:hypothetical protein
MASDTRNPRAGDAGASADGLPGGITAAEISWLTVENQLAAARALAAAFTLGGMGFACIPCRRENKRPMTPHGFKDAVREREAIEDLWRQYPGPLVGVATGEMSGVSVLDIDAKHNTACKWWDEHRDRLLPARVHRTRSGGLHVVYRHRPGLKCSVSKIAHGVDVRADGGYVIWWPAADLAVLADAGLRPWPDWLAVEAPAPTPPRLSISRRALAARSDALTRARAIGLVRVVVDAREGERNQSLFWATCRAHDMIVKDEIDHGDGMEVLQALREAAASSGLGRHEIERTITSAMRAAP